MLFLSVFRLLQGTPRLVLPLEVFGRRHRAACVHIRHDSAGVCQKSILHALLKLIKITAGHDPIFSLCFAFDLQGSLGKESLGLRNRSIPNFLVGISRLDEKLQRGVVMGSAVRLVE